MPRKRKESIPLQVDVDGIDVPAVLRPPAGGRACYYVRWKLNGIWHSASTGTNVLFEAQKAGRQIVRGERDPKAKAAGILSVEQFLEVQRQHYLAKAFTRKGQRSWKRFMGVWRSFSKRFPVECVQEVDAAMALKYIQKLAESRRDSNYRYKTKNDRKVAKYTLIGHVSSLRAAWNRVRYGHGKAKAGIPPSNMVRSNPWEEIVNNLPEPTKKVPIQFNLSDGQFDKLLDKFDGREVARLFLIVSLWAAGRIEEVCMIEWEWVQGEGYIAIPDEIAKKGFGKVIRIPPSILARLQAVRVKGNLFIFAGFPDELRRHYRSKQKTAHHADKVMDFSPSRLLWRMSKHIKKAAGLSGLTGISHHAIRRTAMELSDEGELLAAEERSAEKLRTTTENKRGHYLQRKVAKRHYLLADALYANLTASLREFPKLAERVGVEAADPKIMPDLEHLVAGLTPQQRQELLLALIRGTFGKDPGAA